MVFSIKISQGDTFFLKIYQSKNFKISKDSLDQVFFVLPVDVSTINYQVLYFDDHD